MVVYIPDSALQGYLLQTSQGERDLPKIPSWQTLYMVFYEAMVNGLQKTGRNSSQQPFWEASGHRPGLTDLSLAPVWRCWAVRMYLCCQFESIPFQACAAIPLVNQGP